MAAAARAANFHGFGTPDGIVVMLLSDQGMGNLVENGVCDFLLRRAFGKFRGQRDDMRRVLTTTRALGGTVKLETPLVQLIARQQGSGPLGNGLELLVTAAHRH